MKKWILFVVLNLLMISQAEAAVLTAKVNRNPVPAGETFVLSLEYDGDPGSSRPDFSVLNRDFNVYMVSNSYRGSYSGGQMKKTYIWNVSMAADQAGTYTIPPLKVGNASSRAISLKVVDPAAMPDDLQNASAAPRFAVSRSIDNADPLVQQQINYSFKITTSEALQGNAPQFMAVGGGDEWIIRSLGDPRIESKIQNGVEVKEITFNYALFPQKSGSLVIPEVRFEGYYLDPEAHRNNSVQSLLGAFRGLDDDAFGLGMFGARVPVTLKARPISIEVGKIPEENNGYWWLPAKKAEIYSDWQKKLPQFKSGEAVNREIYLRVTGVIDTQLPKIKFAEIPGVKQYPEKPAIQSEVKNGDVVSVMKINTVYIPEKSGPLTIPAITVHWYNVDSGKMEKAVLPAVTVQVPPGATLPTAEETASAAPSRGEQLKTLAEDEVKLLKNAAPAPVIWYIVTAFAAGIAAAAGLFGLWMLRHPRQKNKEETVAPAAPVSVAKAVRSNDLRAIRDNVMAWGRKQYPQAQVRNLDDIAKLSGDPQFAVQLQQLRKALYSGTPEGFDAAKFMNVFADVSRNRKKQSSKEAQPLPELYR